eukprot:scaffold327_cov257-Pinguiococcus_pyrenoidosus.AAC.19
MRGHLLVIVHVAQDLPGEPLEARQAVSGSELQHDGGILLVVPDEGQQLLLTEADERGRPEAARDHRESHGCVRILIRHLRTGTAVHEGQEPTKRADAQPILKKAAHVHVEGVA